MTFAKMTFAFLGELPDKLEDVDALGCNLVNIGGHDPFLRSGTLLQFLGTEERTRYILKRVTDQVTSVTLVAF